jgi:hypothetical protein
MAACLGWLGLAFYKRGRHSLAKPRGLATQPNVHFNAFFKWN